MKYLDLSFSSPAECLACDETLLDLCESGRSDEILLFWEAREYFAVVGYANEINREVNVPACQSAGIKVFRRCSGGGTVLQGPGCLSYSLILNIADRPPLQTIKETNSFILSRQIAALTPLLGDSVHAEGQTDLALGSLKFSGNAQRRRRRFLIFHGTFLLNFDLSLIGKFLRMPSKQPDYRHDRPHAEFVTNLNLPPAAIKSALQNIWSAQASSLDLPEPSFAEMVKKYSSDAWNLKF